MKGGPGTQVNAMQHRYTPQMKSAIAPCLSSGLWNAIRGSTKIVCISLNFLAFFHFSMRYYSKKKSIKGVRVLTRGSQAYSADFFKE